MLKAPATGTNLSFPNAQSVKNVLPQLNSVATRYGLTYACIEFLATPHCGALDCVQRGDCGCNAASLSEGYQFRAGRL
jgi:hypothetical protein